MRIRAPELDTQLGRSLAPVYTVYGEELLLALEAADAIRAAARRKGFSERAVLEPSGRAFDWSELDRAGVIVEAEAVARSALPTWLKQRLARQKQSASPEALEYLAARV